jgi:hypothetical protein
MKSLDKDWAYFRAAIPDVQDYLLSPELYWQLSGAGGLLQLTIGNLLLSQKRLNSFTWPDVQRLELVKISGKLQQVRERWRANWMKKASLEFSNRLKRWGSYLSQRTRNQPGDSPAYAQQVRLRAILVLLYGEIQSPMKGEMEQLAALDQLLRKLAKPGPFVWESEISAGFDQDKYWFLYLSV